MSNINIIKRSPVLLKYEWRMKRQLNFHNLSNVIIERFINNQNHNNIKSNI